MNTRGILHVGGKNKVAPIPVSTKSSKPTTSQHTANPLIQISEHVLVEPALSFPCPILQLPRRVRLMIWKRAPRASIGPLRRTHPRIKYDIDNYVGLCGLIDDSSPSFGFFTQVGLESLIVVNLSGEGNITKFISRPGLLRELYVCGEISSEYFDYIMDSCSTTATYLTSFKIRFTPKTIARHTYFFPARRAHWTLRYVREVSIEAVTRSEPDLAYVRQNLAALFTQDMAGCMYLEKLKVTLTHRAFASWEMKEVHHAVTEFVNINADYLTNLCIEINDKQLESDHESRTDFVDRILRKGSADLRGSIASNTGSHDLTAFLNRITDSPNPRRVITSWNTFSRLKRLYLCVNGEYCEYWKAAFTQTLVLEYLFLEMSYDDNWTTYCSFIQPALGTLVQVDLYLVTRTGNLGLVNDYTPIDLGLFHFCRKLCRLSVNFRNGENGIKYVLNNLLRLPRSLVSLQMSWIILSPCTLFRLALFHRRLTQLDIGYWSVSPAKLARFLCLLRYLLKFHLTNLRRIVITDYKMKFQERGKAVRSFLKSHKCSTFTDSIETYIVYDRHASSRLPADVQAIIMPIKNAY